MGDEFNAMMEVIVPFSEFCERDDNMHFRVEDTYGNDGVFFVLTYFMIILTSKLPS